jgi:hypothetical protein
MNYSEFKKHTIKKNIHLFDAYSRIIYFKLFNNNNLQVGGSNKISITKIIKKLDGIHLKIFLDSVYDDNIVRIKYIVNNYL